MYKILTILLFPFYIFSQDVIIEKLSNEVNSNNAELNFIQLNDSTSYYTVVSQSNGALLSEIYSLSLENGKWNNKHFSNYNSTSKNTANISFFEGNITLLTLCDETLKSCRVVYRYDSLSSDFVEIPFLNSTENYSTQAFITLHNSQKVLYFVSDRKGGFGGLDIWISIIDNNGKFGIPINAGLNINSSFNELTPFYNTSQEALYYSSDRSGGLGGIDIYKSLGSLNLWGKAKNVESLNSIKDELYLTFYDKNNGYLSSNRNSCSQNTTEYCCNDIFTFEYFPDTLEAVNNPKIEDYLPLDLYFHNDEPEISKVNASSSKTYKDSYISYYKLQSLYYNKNPDLNNFFENVLKANFNALNNLLELLLVDLNSGRSIELKIIGYASPLHNVNYNKKLSERRILSLINYLREFKKGKLVEYLSSNKLTIIKDPNGEINSAKEVSDDINDKRKSIYSIGAMLERRIQIIKVISKD